LFQFGHSKDDPTLPQVKVMMGVLDPLGLPLVTQVVSGETADDGLYVPAIEQVQQTLERTGLLFVGDCKLAALETRRWIQAQGQYYLCPLASTGKVPEQLSAWVTQALQDSTQQIEVKVSQGSSETVIAHGIEVHRSLKDSDSDSTWDERVFVVCSPQYAKRQRQALQKRLQTATDKLNALTPAPGRGKRQIRTEAALHQQASAILVQYRVEGLLTYQVEKQTSQAESFVGRGRASNRPKQITETVRYQITSVAPQTAAITALEATLGW
jgi:transposase